MDLQATDVVIDRIVRAGSSGVAAFDADGTLWSGDIGDDLFHAMIAGEAFLPATRDALAIEATHAGIEAGSTPTATVLALVEAFRRGVYPEERLLEIVAWGLAGRTRDEVHAFSRDVLANSTTLKRLQDETHTVLQAIRKSGVEIYVVSASPREIVEEAVRDLGIDAAHVCAATARYTNERMITDVERPITYGPGKVAGLRACIGDRPLLAAFGDNTFDAEMLREARVPVAIRPKEGLRRLAPTIHGIVELAR